MRTSRNHPRRARSGFTLVELLTVVMIIMLLVGILLPALAGVRIAAMREKCKHNCKEIAKSSVAYAMDGAKHRGTLGNALPSSMTNVGAYNNATFDNTLKVQPCNIGGLWLLYRQNFLGPEFLFCGEAEQQREAAMIKETDTNGFLGGNVGSTACYSYLSMAWEDSSGGSKVTRYGVSYEEMPSYAVLVADWNPRVAFGGSTAGTVDENSWNHKKEGQNFARIDGSAEWTEVREIFVKIVNGQTLNDNIYQNRVSSSVGGPRQEYTFNSVALPAHDDFLLH